MKNILCLLTREATYELAELYKSFSIAFDVYVCANERGKDFALLQKVYIDYNIRLISPDTDRCLSDGYYGSLFSKDVERHADNVRAFDKALWQFSRNFESIHKNQKLWFAEDDVFIPCSDTLQKLDQTYATADLVVRSHISEDRLFEWSHLSGLKRQLARINVEECFASMVPLMRVSGELFRLADLDTIWRGRPGFCEGIWNSLAQHFALEIRVAPELNNIRFRTLETWHLRVDQCLHALKGLDKHRLYRWALAVLRSCDTPNAQSKIALCDLPLEEEEEKKRHVLTCLQKSHPEHLPPPECHCKKTRVSIWNLLYENVSSE